MAKIKFRDIRLSADNKLRLTQINNIIAEYQKLGLRLTLRQLYYQLVSRDIIPNKLPEYAKLSKILTEGRMSGIVDWAAIEDRLRSAEKPSSWDSPKDIMDTVIAAYAKPRLHGQTNYIEVWVEKDALSGVLSEVTRPYHVPIQVNRGYSSVTAIYASYKRFRDALEAGQHITILYLGDFDPSGVDMIRDVYDRPLEMLLAKATDVLKDIYEPDAIHEEGTTIFEHLETKYYDDKRAWSFDDDEERHYFDPWKALVLDRFQVVSIALTTEQIDQYNPPPNPAKMTDPRAADFVAKHGYESWEVDALRPEVLNTLLTDAIENLLDLGMYGKVLAEEKKDKAKLTTLKNKL